MSTIDRMKIMILKIIEIKKCLIPMNIIILE
jgi:hypothetical protein